MSSKRSLNKAILVGTLGRDAEITHVQSANKDVIKFSVATTESYKSDGKWIDETEWHNVIQWSGSAQHTGYIQNHFLKGSMVLVEGRIKTRKWQDRDGNERRTTEIQAEKVVLLHGGKQSEQGETQAAYDESEPF